MDREAPLNTGGRYGTLPRAPSPNPVGRPLNRTTTRWNKPAQQACPLQIQERWCRSSLCPAAWPTKPDSSRPAGVGLTLRRWRCLWWKLNKALQPRPILILSFIHSSFIHFFVFLLIFSSCRAKSRKFLDESYFKSNRLLQSNFSDFQVY